MNLICKGIIASLLTCGGLLAEDAPKKAPATSVVADPKATGEWLASLFTVQNNQILVAGKPSDKYRETRLKFSRPTEIRTYRGRIIADQEELYPLIIGPDDNGYEVTVYTPFYAFLDEILEPDGCLATRIIPKTRR